MHLGIIGGGQLGRMLAQAAAKIKVDVTILDPQVDCSAGQVANQIVGDYDDAEKLTELAEKCDAVTYEFENVPVTAVSKIADRVRLHPPPPALATAQDRLIEKTTFREIGIDTADFAPVDSLDELRTAVGIMNGRCILKMRRFGYDGKGQFSINSSSDVDLAWEELGSAGPLILEKRIDFKRELAIVAARDEKGNEIFYPVTQTHHKSGILHASISPAPNLTDAVIEQADRYVDALLKKLDYVGVLALELFETENGLLGNEFAPRVHNSGHWTIEGTACSQFENQVRAVLDMPLGNADAIGPTAMLNLIGWIPADDHFASVPNATLHLYGKDPRPGRKVGHLTISANDHEQLSESLHRAEALCSNILE